MIKEIIIMAVVFFAIGVFFGFKPKALSIAICGFIASIIIFSIVKDYTIARALAVTICAVAFFYLRLSEAE